jgi:hypothetical protein
MKQLKEKGFTTIQVPVENNKEILTHAIKGVALLQNEWVTKTVKIAPVGV